MDLYAVLDQVQERRQQRGRLTYRVLKAQFKLDEEDLEALKEELIEGQQVAADEGGKVLVWKGGTVPRGSRAARQLQRQLPPVIRLPIWPSASAPSKRRWKRGGHLTVSAKPSPRCLPISKARRR